MIYVIWTLAAVKMAVSVPIRSCLAVLKKIADEEVRTPEYFISEETDDAEVDEDDQFGYADAEENSEDNDDGEDGWDD